MRPYVIVTDSGCDIVPATLREWGVIMIPLTFRFDGEDKEYSDGELASTAFYNQMREGKIAKTAAINTERFRAFFEEQIQNGNDVLYIGFSSGLSSTYNAGRTAAELLSAQYPEPDARSKGRHWSSFPTRFAPISPAFAIGSRSRIWSTSSAAAESVQ